MNRAIAHPGKAIGRRLARKAKPPGGIDYCAPIVQTVLVVVMPSVPLLSDR